MASLHKQEQHREFLWCNVVAAMRGMLWRLCGGKPNLVISIFELIKNFLTFRIRQTETILNKVASTLFAK